MKEVLRRRSFLFPNALETAIHRQRQLAPHFTEDGPIGVSPCGAN
jgi:hypothetical protein